MATGDLRNNICRLQSLLKSIRYPDLVHTDEQSNSLQVLHEGLATGDPKLYLTIFHYLFLDFSHSVALSFNAKGYDFVTRTDQRFMEAVYRLLLNEFNYKPALRRDQFFSAGAFAERKILFCCDTIEFIRSKHRELERSSGRKLSNSGVSRRALKVKFNDETEMEHQVLEDKDHVHQQLPTVAYAQTGFSGAEMTLDPSIQERRLALSQFQKKLSLSSPSKEKQNCAAVSLDELSFDTEFSQPASLVTVRPHDREIDVSDTDREDEEEMRWDMPQDEPFNPNLSAEDRPLFTAGPLGYRVHRQEVLALDKSQYEDQSNDKLESEDNESTDNLLQPLAKVAESRQREWIRSFTADVNEKFQLILEQLERQSERLEQLELQSVQSNPERKQTASVATLTEKDESMPQGVQDPEPKCSVDKPAADMDTIVPALHNPVHHIQQQFYRTQHLLHQYKNVV